MPEVTQQGPQGVTPSPEQSRPCRPLPSAQQLAQLCPGAGRGPGWHSLSLPRLFLKLNFLKNGVARSEENGSPLGLGGAQRHGVASAVPDVQQPTRPEQPPPCEDTRRPSRARGQVFGVACGHHAMVGQMDPHPLTRGPCVALLRPLLAQSPAFSGWEGASLPFISQRVSQAGGAWPSWGPRA